MIEGDNLEVLKLLQKSYAGKVRLIYLDPPYNTGKDFIYPDNYQDGVGNYLELTAQVESGNRVSSNTETGGRFHTAWLNMMYPRVKLARSLLRTDGFVFISIDQGELPALMYILREVFGEENQVEVFSWVRTRTPAALSKKTKTVTEFIVCFQKADSSQSLLGIEKPAQSANTLLNQPNPIGELCFPIGTPAGFSDCTLQPGMYGSDSYQVELLEAAEVCQGAFRTPLRLRARFRWSQAYLEEQIARGVQVRIATKRLLPSYEKDSYGREALPNLIDEKVGVGTNEEAGSEVARLLGEKGIASFPKPVSLLRYLVASCTSGDDIVVDLFAGSGTTAHAVLEQNSADNGARRFILVQLPEPLDSSNADQFAAATYCQKLGKPSNIAEITKNRVRRAAAKIQEENPLFAGDLGFRVFRLDAGNIREWAPDRERVKQSLLESIDHLRSGRSDDDLLYELLLKFGVDLCAPIEYRLIRDIRICAVGGGVLVLCMAGTIDAANVEAVAQEIVDWLVLLAPAGGASCVFRDSAFVDDVAKVNMAAILEQNGVRSVKSI
jgi:adenine-specific DNA-methyltransferase